MITSAQKQQAAVPRGALQRSITVVCKQNIPVKPQPARLVCSSSMFTKQSLGFLHPASILYHRWEIKQLCEPPDAVCMGIF